MFTLKVSFAVSWVQGLNADCKTLLGIWKLMIVFGCLVWKEAERTFQKPFQLRTFFFEPILSATTPATIIPLSSHQWSKENRI